MTCNVYGCFREGPCGMPGCPSGKLRVLIDCEDRALRAKLTLVKAA